MKACAVGRDSSLKKLFLAPDSTVAKRYVHYLVDANSRLRRKPGDPDSNDPEAKIKQPYTQAEKSGGFLSVSVKPETANKSAVLWFTWYDGDSDGDGTWEAIEVEGMASVN